MKQLSELDQPQITMELTTLDVAEIESEGQYEDVLFQGGIVTGKKLEHVYFRRVHFKNVTFEGVNFHQMELMDVVFEGCNISNTEMISANIHRTAFKRTKLVGTNFSDSTCVGVSFDDCQANYSAFYDATLKRVFFQETSLVAAEMIHLTWEKLGLENCRIDGLQLDQTRLAGLDLSRCQFEYIAFTPELVRGLVIEPSQSLALVSQLGVTIKDI